MPPHRGRRLILTGSMRIVVPGTKYYIVAATTPSWETQASQRRPGVAEDGEGGGGRAGVSPYPRGAWVAVRWGAQRTTPAAARGAEPPPLHTLFDTHPACMLYCNKLTIGN